MNVSCGIMKNKSNKILLGLRPDNKPHPGIWEFPGGKQEKNETIKESLIREWKEELNLNIEIDKKITEYESGGYICHFYEGTILNEEDLQINIHKKIGWFSKNEIRKLNLFQEDYQIIDSITE